MNKNALARFFAICGLTLAILAPFFLMSVPAARGDRQHVAAVMSCDVQGRRDWCSNEISGDHVVYLPTVVRQHPPLPPLFTIVVGTNAEYPPFEYVDDHGNIVGFDIDLLDAIGRAARFEPRYVNTRWDGILVALAYGEFDAVISAVTITDQRKQQVDFSDPYFNTGPMIAVRADNVDINGPEDLPGHFVGVQLGTTGDIVATQIVGDEYMKRYEEITLAMQALANGDVDAVVSDGPTLVDIIQANPGLNLKVVGEPLTDDHLYGIAVRKGLAHVLRAINEGLAAVCASGEYGNISKKWFGPTLSCPPIPSP